MDVILEISALFVSAAAFVLPGWAEAPFQSFFERIAPPARAEIIFGGDMMFDRYIRTVSEREGGDFILSCIAPVLQEADLVVANLEGPITGNASMSVGSAIGAPENFTFTFPASTATLLKRHNIGLVNLGNNHIMNFGESGVRETMVALSEAGVGFFGSPLMSALVRQEVEGVRIEFVSYNEFGGMGEKAAINQIQFARENGYLPVVYTHWGEEYVPAHERDKELARRFIDAGAEIVIGSHPHVIQEHEEYRGKHIYYSLGNLVFDQYWNEEVRTGLLLKITFNKSGIERIEEIRTELQRDGQTCLKERG